MKVSEAAVPRAAARRSRAGLPRPAALRLAILLALPGSASATALVNWEAGIGFLHSDNITLSENDPESETAVLGSLRVLARRDSTKVNLRARGSAQYIHYFGDTFDSELRGELAAQLNWKLVPDRVHWVFEDYLSRQPINVLAGLVPSNQQFVNVFVTGPSFYGRFGPATRGQFDLRYSTGHAEESDAFDGHRVVAGARLFREVSPITSLSLNAEATMAEFDDDDAADYRRTDVFIGWERRMPAIDLNVEAGRSRLEPEGDRAASSAPLVRASLQWRPLTRNSFTARFDHQLADASQELIHRGIELNDDTYIPMLTGNELFDSYDGLAHSDLVISPDVYRERRVEFGYRYSGERATVTLRPYVQRVRYDADLNPDAVILDQRSKGQALGIDYRLKPRMTLSFTAAVETRRFRTIERVDRDRVARLALDNQLSSHVRWRLELEHRNRDSSALDRSYRENAIIASLVYRR